MEHAHRTIHFCSQQFLAGLLGRGDGLRGLHSSTCQRCSLYNHVLCAVHIDDTTAVGLGFQLFYSFQSCRQLVCTGAGSAIPYAEKAQTSAVRRGRVFMAPWL